MPTIIHDSLDDRFPHRSEPDWYPEAVRYLRGGADRGLFGLYLYHLVTELNEIETVINIGTARGHSAVCLAKGLERSRGGGTVHTIDLTPPDKSINWHVSKQPESDPANGTKFTMRELVERFHGPKRSVDIRYHTGESNDVLQNWTGGSPDLVFHDAEHTHEAVSTDIRLTERMGDSNTVHVFDDCYLYHDEWQRHVVNPAWYTVFDSLPRIDNRIGRIIRNKSRDLVRELTQLSLSKTPFPGVGTAVQEAYDTGEWEHLEIVRDDDHSPITALM